MNEIDHEIHVEPTYDYFADCLQRFEVRMDVSMFVSAALIALLIVLAITST